MFDWFLIEYNGNNNHNNETIANIDFGSLCKGYDEKIESASMIRLCVLIDANKYKDIDVEICQLDDLITKNHNITNENLHAMYTKTKSKFIKAKLY